MFGGFFLIGVLGPLLQLPERLMDISPFTHIPQVPSENPTVAPLAWLTAVAAALTLAGVLACRRRDIS